jgi:hypothetical protein
LSVPSDAGGTEPDDLRAVFLHVVTLPPSKLPPGARELAKVPGVGPRRALQIAGQLGPKSEERILRGIGVAASDAVLRGALRALPANATEDDIYAVLAANVARNPGAVAPQAERGRGGEDAAPVREKDLIGVADLRGDLHTQTYEPAGRDM